MINFEREVKDLVLIEEMLKMFNIVNVGINGDDGYPYVVPLNFGFEVKDNIPNMIVEEAQKLTDEEAEEYKKRLSIVRGA